MHNNDLYNTIDELKQELATLKQCQISLKNRLKTKKTHIFAGIFLAFICTTFVLYAAQFKTFEAGHLISASEINANFSRVVPIGGIIAWHKDFANTPALPDSFVECNGQTLSDSESPYNGQLIPNINGISSGAAINGLTARTDKPALFLRGIGTGGATGVGQDDALQGHYHQSSMTDTLAALPAGGIERVVNGFGNSGQVTDFASNIVTDGTNGTPRINLETRPVNMSVVWIMRVK